MVEVRDCVGAERLVYCGGGMMAAQEKTRTAAEKREIKFLSGKGGRR